MAMFAERGDERVKLWTMQTRDVWESLQRTGVYRTDTALCWMAEELPHAYSWLAREMTKRVGPPPQGVDYPVWAWYMQNGRHKKPDLRSERWCYGPGDEDYCCIELEIVPQRVLLSDFDVCTASSTTASFLTRRKKTSHWRRSTSRLQTQKRPPTRKRTGRRVFDISPLNNNWTTRANGCRPPSGNSGARMSAPCAFSAQASTSALPRRDEGRCGGQKAASSLYQRKRLFTCRLNPPAARARR